MGTVHKIFERVVQPPREAKTVQIEHGAAEGGVFIIIGDEEVWLPADEFAVFLGELAESLDDARYAK